MSKTRKYFGTDGIRGHVGNSIVNPEFMLKLGWALGKVLAREGSSKVLIGKDTRISGYMFESALEAGLSAAGVDTHLLGPMPTPAIAYLTRTLRAQAGIVISASHNQYDDNGIKFFSAEGSKLPDDIEISIEKQLEKNFTTADSANLGKALRIVDAPGRYIEFCKSTVSSDIKLNGLKIVIDCANGATYHIAPNVFRELGADVIELAVSPNGFNINDHCGATHPETVRAAVLEHHADLGIAFDGDGDRVVMVDHLGNILDGDALLYIIARHHKNLGKLEGGVVGTHMSNYGLEQAFLALDIPFARSNVGDRYVLEALQKRRWSLGGEASGHIICLGLTTTGDGIVAALQVLSALSHQNCSLADLVCDLHKVPQVLVNVKMSKLVDFSKNKSIQAGIAHVESQLQNSGRVLLRKSGTEPLMRVMVEGEDQQTIEKLAEYLSDIVRQEVTAE